ncbi:MAG: indole-3-glycerol phosphate synthase TrpC [Euzebya sp.]
MSSGFLEQVCREARQRVVEDRTRESEQTLLRRAQQTPDPPSFAAALAKSGVAVITEIKRASPSRGHMSDIADPVALAHDYVAGGAAAISVLTEPAHFLGSLADLSAVAAAVSVPVLRKDFIVEDYQVWQSRAAGAAAVLLIVAGLEDTALTRLITTTTQAGLDCLIETHSAAEIARAVRAHEQAERECRLILGVNARDLVTLEVDREHISRVRAEADLPSGAILVAESGIRGPADVRSYAAVGADAVLVGEHVSTAADSRAAVAALVAVAATASP